MQRLPVIRSLYVLTICAAAASAQGWLDVARWYLQPSEGEFHYVADVNSDGFDDLVWFKGMPDTPTVWDGFQVFFNDGTGDFPVHGPFVPLPTGNRFAPLDLDGVRRLEDLTGDGHPDLLLVEELPASALDVALHIYRGQPDGSFAAPVSIPVTEFDSATLGNIDGDPAFELALCDEVEHDERITWHNWNGTAFVGAGGETILGSFGSPSVARMVAFDVDADGDDDLVLGQWGGLNLRVLLTQPGDLTLGQQLTVGSSTSNGLYPFLCDLSGGGAQDLLVVRANFSSSLFDVIPVLVQGGVLVAGAAQPFSNGAGIVYGEGFDVGDWDEDGDADLMHYPWQEPGGTTEGIVAFFANDGANDFGTAPVATAEMIYSGLTGLGVADVDLDGHLDFVGAQTILFGRGVIADSLAEVTDFFFGSDPLVVADVEGDGDLDIIHAFSGAKLNDGTGAFPVSMPLPAPPAPKLNNGATAIADLTGDGRIDILLELMNPPPTPFQFPTFAEMRLYVDNGLGAFVDAGTANLAPMLPFARELQLVLDVDQDGDNDVFDTEFNGGYWPNDGAGHFTSFVTLFPGLIEAVAAADLDGDADVDVMAFSGFPASVVLEQQTAPLAYAPTVISEGDGGVDSESIALADADADGDLDLVFATGSDSILLYENDGLADFTQAAELSTDIHPIGGDPRLIHYALQDVDGDGVIDLLGGGVAEFNETPNKVGLFRGTGDFAFEPVRWYAGGSMGPSGDVDGDGDLDLSGRVVVRSRLFDGADDGIIRQYGAGTAGGTGVAPVLGAAGPLRPGSETAQLRLRRAKGAAPLLLLYGLGEAALSGQPFASATLYVEPPFASLFLVSGGAPGVPGAGTLNLGLQPVLPIAAGISVYIQAAVFSGGPGGKVVSNGLQLTFGL
jgi:FG-GAP-like repeat